MDSLDDLEPVELKLAAIRALANLGLTDPPEGGLDMLVAIDKIMAEATDPNASKFTYLTMIHLTDILN